MNREFASSRFLVSILLVGVCCSLAGAASAQTLRLVPETGHSGEVNSASFSPDGARVVTTSDRTAKVWDLATGKELLALDGHTAGVYSASFSPDGRRIVTASGDKTAKLWDAASGKLLLTLTGHTNVLRCAAYSPDGKRIATASWDKSAKVWDAATGKELLTLLGHTGMVGSVAFSPDGARLVTSSSDKTARVWDATSGKLLLTLDGHTGQVATAAFSPDGRHIVTASWDDTAKVWDAKTGKVLLTLDDQSDLLTGAAYSPDGKRIVTASEDYTASEWDAGSGKKLVTLKGHTDSATSATFSPDGKLIATASADQSAKVWIAATGKELMTLTGYATRALYAAYSPDGKMVVTPAWDKIAKVWDAASGKDLLTLSGHTDYVVSAMFSPDGKRIVTSSWDKTAKVWDAATGKALLTLAGHSDHVTFASFSPDGKRIVTASSDKTAKVWDADTGKQLLTLAGHTGWVVFGSYSPNGDRIITAAYDGAARVWDAATGKPLSTLTSSPGLLNSAAYSPDGTRIVTASSDKTARVWDAATGKPLLTLSGHRHNVMSAAFSRDGKRIVTASMDKTAKVWDAATGKLLGTLSGHTDWVYSAMFSPDDKSVLTASEDASTRLWSAESGRPLYARYGFGDGSWIALAPDGRYDSSDGPRPHFGHFVMDIPSAVPEIVGFDQIRTEEFYEPGLIDKIDTGVYVPGEQPLLTQKPFPKIDQSVIGESVKFRVTERGNGGIGEIRILVNGQAKDRFAKGKVASGQWVTWNGKGVLGKGMPVDVVADNAAQTLTSSRGGALQTGADSKAPLRFVGVAMGVKDYLGSIPHLKFAGADAVAVTRAMLALAKSIHAKPELFLLTDEPVPQELRAAGVRVLAPSKANYTKVYAELKATTFSANTLLFLDFSGHGVMVGGQYVYLTQDARTADPVELKSQLGRGVTMSEILEFLNLGLASKRLLVLDTCQAAGAKNQLAATMNRGDSERDAEAKTVADWQNRYAVGTQVLMGCPMGASSYESESYGHGLLTYSLLYCLRNDELGDRPGDPNDIEVLANKLVTDAVSRTRKFAGDIGLNQFAIPMGVTSFPIGNMSRAARRLAIDLPEPKPAVGACMLLDADDLPVSAFDAAFIDRLEGSARGGTVVHIVSLQAPDVWTVTGRYLLGADGRVTLRLRLSCPGHKPGILPDIIASEASAPNEAYAAISKWLTASAIRDRESGIVIRGS